MKATIQHDEHGRIIAISKAANLKEAGSKFTKAGMVAGPGQRIIETELSAEDASRPMRELHTEYRVNAATSKLVKQER